MDQASASPVASCAHNPAAPRRFWCTYAWNRPASTGAGGSDPLWLGWRGKPWLADRWGGYAASRWSQFERHLISGPAAITNRDIAASAFADRLRARTDGALDALERRPLLPAIARRTATDLARSGTMGYVEK